MSRAATPHASSPDWDALRRGIHRLVYFPAGQHEDLVALWLWSEQAGVFSHDTAAGSSQKTTAPSSTPLLTVRQRAPGRSPHPATP